MSLSRVHPAAHPAYNQFSWVSLGLLVVARGSYGLVVDATTQFVRPNKEAVKKEAEEEEEDRDEEAAKAKENFNWKRNFVYGAVGAFYLQPLEYGQMLLVTKWFPGTSLRVAGIKTAFDMFVLHPFNCASAIALNQLLMTGGDCGMAWKKLKQDFWYLQTRLWLLRPVLDVITFVSLKGVVSQMLVLGAVYFIIDIWVNEQVNRPVLMAAEPDGVGGDTPTPTSGPQTAKPPEPGSPTGADDGGEAAEPDHATPRKPVTGPNGYTMHYGLASPLGRFVGGSLSPSSACSSVGETSREPTPRWRRRPRSSVPFESPPAQGAPCDGDAGSSAGRGTSGVAEAVRDVLRMASRTDAGGRRWRRRRPHQLPIGASFVTLSL